MYSVRRRRSYVVSSDSTVGVEVGRASEQRNCVHSTWSKGLTKRKRCSHAVRWCHAHIFPRVVALKRGSCIIKLRRCAVRSVYCTFVCNVCACVCTLECCEVMCLFFVPLLALNQRTLLCIKLAYSMTSDCATPVNDPHLTLYIAHCVSAHLAKFKDSWKRWCTFILLKIARTMSDCIARWFVPALLTAVIIIKNSGITI